MSFLDIIAIVFLATGTVYWSLVLYFTIRVIRSVPLLEEIGEIESGASEPVAVIIPTWNQAEDVEGRVRERLREDRPNLEFVLVDGGSSDGTAELIDELAASDGRVKAVHVEETPGGWLGKIYAMQRGVEESEAEWYIFSDADSHFEPGAVDRALALCEERKLDYLAVVPELYPSSYLLDSIFQVFLRIMLLAERAWAVEENGGAAVGSAPFNLVRADALERAGGLAEIRLEPSEDVALAQMIKGAGGRCWLANGRGFVGVHFHRSLRETMVESEPGVYTSMGNFSLARICFFALLLLLLELGPYFFFLPLGIPYHDWIGTAAVILGIIVSILVCRWIKLPLGAAFFFPVDIVVVIYLIIRAGVVCSLRGGIWSWGSFYPTEMLRLGRRFSYH
jgi:glycosyltransferase involved in cell wall biosynthesis